MRDTSTARRAPVRIDPVSGYPAIQWNLTPPDQRDKVQVCLPEPQQARILYPVRYGITRAPFPAGDFPDMDLSGYEGLGEGWHFGLRTLRPLTYVYLLAQVKEEWRIRVWQVAEDGYFNPISSVSTEEASQPPWQDMPTLPEVTAALPYITAPLPTPELDVGERAWLLVSDSRLTRGVLDALTSDQDGLRSQLATEIRLTDDGPQSHTGDTAPLADLPGLNGDLDAFVWSESNSPVTPANQLLSLLDASVSPRCGVMQQHPAKVVAVHDTTGVMSELGHLAGIELEALQSYSADAARKLRISEWIDLLGEMKRREVEMDTFRNDPVGSALPGGVAGGAANAARDRAYQEGLDAEAGRLAMVRNEERHQFVNDHPNNMERLGEAVTQAASAATQVYRSIKARHNATLMLYDETDRESYLALRRVVTFSLGVLTLDDEGVNEVSGELVESGPTGIMERVLLGHPQVSEYVRWRSSAARFARNVVGEVIEKLNTVISSFPADSASRQLSLVVGALVAKGRLGSINELWRTPYGPALEILSGETGVKRQVPLSEAGAWLRDRTGGRGVNGFRPITVARAANEVVELYESQQVQAQIEADQRGLSQRMHFWHGTKLGISGLGIWWSLENAAAAIKKLGRDDGMVLANSLNLGSAMLATSAGVTGGIQAVLDIRRNQARIAADQALEQSMEKQVDLLGNWALGLAAGAALVTFVKDAVVTPIFNEDGNEAAISMTGGILQLGNASLGMLHLTARLADQAEKMGATAARGRITQSATQVMSRLESGGAALRGLGRFARASNWVGWVMLAVEASYVAVRHWHDTTVEENKVLRWMAGSVWGNGSIPAWFGLSDEEVTTLDADAELKEFYRMFREPSIETNTDTLKWLSGNLPLVSSYRRWTTGSPYPEGVEQIAILLPGWQAQVSSVRVTVSAPQTIPPVEDQIYTEENASVSVERGLGIMMIDTNNPYVSVKVRYYVNGFSDPELMYEVEN